MQDKIKDIGGIAGHIETGRAICIYEPRGDHGLEGYQLNQEYTYAKHFGPIRNSANKTRLTDYYRIYPEGSFSSYYEIATPIDFNKYFKIKTEVTEWYKIILTSN